MSALLLSQFSAQFLEDPSLLRWLQYQSVNTWERISFCRHNERNKIFETTITQNFVFDLLEATNLYEFPVDIYESRSERTNGNDIEIIVETKYGFLTFPIQAKILSKDLIYAGIGHHVGPTFQINLLLSYAKRIEGIPLYLFYNYSDDFFLNDKIEKHTNESINLLGCSIAPAQYLKAAFCNYDDSGRIINFQRPRFADLHPDIALSLYHLITIMLDPLTLANYFSYLDISVDNFHALFKHERPGANGWKNLRPGAVIGRIEPPIAEEQEVEYQSIIPSIERPIFTPRYRIVVYINYPGSALYRNIA